MSNPNEQKPDSPGNSDDRTIIVNGRPKKWAAETITFEQVVSLAFPEASPNPNTVYTVTYKKGGDQGSLVAGGSIAVKPGTIFNVTATDKS
jgi:hypothetical protein